METKTLYLNPGAHKRIKSGHVWIYSNEVDTKKSALKLFSAGEQIIIADANEQPLATAFISPNNLICCRLISRSPSVFMDFDLLCQRLKQAAHLRDTAFNSPFYRLAYGDSDRLPGLIIDRFGDTFVIQIAIAGMEQLKDQIVEALKSLFSPTTILFKNDHKMRATEALENYKNYVLGNEEDTILTENGVSFIAPIFHGQKTGWFYDHRMGRAQLKNFAKGKRVLDLFSYIGGWGIQAAVFGAETVTCVDTSELALSYVEKNAKLNNIENKITCIQRDVFEACQTLVDEKQLFDIVICDPPAFIPRKKDQKPGERAYSKLNSLAMNLLTNDGLLVSGSCSMHLKQETLINIIQSCAVKQNKNVCITGIVNQSADHPILPSVAETNYLKCIFSRVSNT